MRLQYSVGAVALIAALYGCSSDDPPNVPDVNSLPDQTIEFRVAPLVGASDSGAPVTAHWSQNDDRDSIAIEIQGGYHARLNTYEVHALVRRIDENEVVVDTSGRWVAVHVTPASDSAFETRVKVQKAFLKPSQFREILAEPLGPAEHVTRLRVTSRSIRGGVKDATLTLLWPGI